MHTVSLFAITKLADDRENPTGSLLPASMRTFTTARGVEESRASRSLQFCASTALREMITGNRRIRSRVSAINPRFRFFFSFSSSPFQAVNRRHRRLCANVFRNGGRVMRVTHCQDTIHDSAVTLAFVRGWTEIRGGFFGFDRLKYETRFKMILFLSFFFLG